MMKRELSNKDKGYEGIGLFNTFSRLFKIILIFFVAIILLLYFIPVNVLMASNFKSDKYLKTWLIKGGQSFTVLYTHSVELCPVTETYIIENEDIILTETYFESYGAGLPATTPYKFEKTDRGFRIYDINKLIEDLVYRTGGVIANHSISFKNNEYKFLDFSSPREGVRLKIKKIPYLQYIMREVL